MSAAGHSSSGGPGPKPDWLRVKAPAPRQYRATGALLGELELHSVCQEARCPNKGECFAAGTATFLILGDVCTRDCAFCAVEHAVPGVRANGVDAGELGDRTVSSGVRDVDAEEPARLAEAARRLALSHVVITSVTRDDLPDGGAAHFAASVHAVRTVMPAATIEVLIPDLGGDEASLRAVLAAHPDVLNHNIETVPRLYGTVRPQADYRRSLTLLRRAAVWACGSRRPRPIVKTGLMVGLGETAEEVVTVLRDCRESGTDVVTIGQYLRPRAGRLAVERYVTPDEFREYERRGAALGLFVQAAPFVRSSYRAAEALDATRR